jgi:hypothetical protein
MVQGTLPKRPVLQIGRGVFVINHIIYLIYLVAGIYLRGYLLYFSNAYLRSLLYHYRLLLNAL